jgi:hypothetical protein
MIGTDLDALRVQSPVLVRQSMWRNPRYIGEDGTAGRKCPLIGQLSWWYSIAATHSLAGATTKSEVTVSCGLAIVGVMTGLPKTLVA